MKTILVKLACTLAVASLVACTGDAGPAGSPGADGQNGMDGHDGADGQNGMDGNDGANGQDGQDGMNGAAAPVDVIAVPSIGPESITAASDGTLYVSSVGDGSITTISPDRMTVKNFIPAEAAQPMGKTGMFVDETNDKFWACAVGTDFATASELRRYKLSDGSLEKTYAMAAGHEAGFCNDIAFDASGNLYITDSFIGVQRLPAGGDTLEDWLTDPLLEPAMQGDFAVDGIAIDGSDMYLNNLEQGTLLRVAIAGDGSAGTPVVIGNVTLSGSDGMRLFAPHTLIIAEGGGAFGGTDALTKVVVDTGNDTGVRTILSNRLDRPAAVVVSEGDAWVTEGQIGRVFGIDADGKPPSVPFLVKRVELFQ
ncbi:MAG TPA: hypothetical protein VHB21_15480 [Minicystis sp.]|nr:hypothetical protein [Minicystis sp.]